MVLPINSCLLLIYSGTWCSSVDGYVFEETFQLCYKFHAESLDQADAGAACAAEGGDCLLRVFTEERKQFMLSSPTFYASTLCMFTSLSTSFLTTYISHFAIDCGLTKHICKCQDVCFIIFFMFQQSD